MPTLPTPIQPRGPAAGKPPMPSPLGGPSGPGGGPMVSPGTGAGQQAMALGQIEGVIDTLFKIAAPFDAGSPELTSILGAIKLLNNMARKKPQDTPRPAPGIPAVQPGAGLGGMPPGGAAGKPPGGPEASAGIPPMPPEM